MSIENRGNSVFLRPRSGEKEHGVFEGFVAVLLSSVHSGVQVFLELVRSQIVSSSRAIASYSGIDNLDEACGRFPDLVFCMIRGQGACATRNVFQDNVAFG
ncbi:MAG TPA: hypothetical protein VHW46_02355, partial [Terracidiphilus sp.]|nr:hypothetical protein [Terracidiphilus sp.]